MSTRLKIGFINVVIALGSLAIIWVQWPEAMKSHGYGGGYEQSFAASIYLAVLLTGIPVLLYAVAVHVALSHWLFSPGEMKAYRARKVVERLPVNDTPAAEASKSSPHDFAD